MAVKRWPNRFDGITVWLFILPWYAVNMATQRRQRWSVIESWTVIGVAETNQLSIAGSNSMQNKTVINLIEKSYQYSLKCGGPYRNFRLAIGPMLKEAFAIFWCNKIIKQQGFDSFNGRFWAVLPNLEFELQFGVILNQIFGRHNCVILSKNVN